MLLRRYREAPRGFYASMCSSLPISPFGDGRRRWHPGARRGAQILCRFSRCQIGLRSHDLPRCGSSGRSPEREAQIRTAGTHEAGIRERYFREFRSRFCNFYSADSMRLALIVKRTVGPKGPSGISRNPVPHPPSTRTSARSPVRPNLARADCIPFAIEPKL